MFSTATSELTLDGIHLRKLQFDPPRGPNNRRSNRPDLKRTSDEEKYDFKLCSRRCRIAANSAATEVYW